MSTTLAVSVAVVTCLLIAAQRADSALVRLRHDTHAGDIRIWNEGPDADPLLSAVAGTDGVEAAGVVRELFVRPVDSDLFPNYNLLAIVPPDPSLGVDVPLVVDGRAPDPDAVDEITISEDFARSLGVGVGDRLALESMSDEWVDVAFNGGDPGPIDGPTVDAEVVGLARTPADFGRVEGVIELSPAFADEFATRIRTYTSVEAKLTDTSVQQVGPGGGDDPVGFLGAPVDLAYFRFEQAAQDGLSTISAALLVAALVSALAGLVVSGLMIFRVAATELVDRSTLMAMGFTRDELTRICVRTVGPWAIAGVVVGTVAGVALSPMASLGLERAVDPAGRSLVLGMTSFAAAAVFAFAGVVLAIIASHRAARPADRTTGGEWAVPMLRNPLSVPLGIRRAFFGAPESGGRASRGAVAATTVAVAIAVGSVLVGTSIQRLQDDPWLSGQGSAAERIIDAGEDAAVYARAMAALEGDQRTADVMGMNIAWGVSGPGLADTPALVTDIRRGSPEVAVIRGRAPQRSDEVAVGPATLDAMHLSVGDEVELASELGTTRFRIVGETLFPEGDFSHDAGIAMTVDGAGFLGGLEATAIHQIVYSWRPDVDGTAADRSIADQGFNAYTAGEGLVPAAVSNLGEVRGIPVMLAGMVMLLGVFTLVHALGQTTRTRRREVGTIRALGLTRPTCRRVVLLQGTAIISVALAAGIPLGLIGGRQVWSLIAQRAHVIDRAVPGWVGIAGVVAWLIAGTLVIALPLAIRSTRERPTAALRAE